MYPGATELERVACFMREVVLACEAGSDVLLRYSPSRRRAVCGARKALQVV